MAVQFVRSNCLIQTNPMNLNCEGIMCVRGQMSTCDNQQFGVSWKERAECDLEQQLCSALVFMRFEELRV